MSNRWVKIGITLISASLIAAHMYWPAIKIDSITVGLFLIALIPWLTSIIESVKAPGGWEVKLRDMKEAGEKVTESIPVAKQFEAISSLSEVAEQDPNLALVGLRIEIEKRLRKLAVCSGLPEQRVTPRLLYDLRQRDLLNRNVFKGLQEIISAGNQAAHGAKIEPSLSEWSFLQGSAILSALDQLIIEQGTL